VRVPIRLEAGREVDVRVDFRPEKRFVTLRLGIAPLLDDEQLIEDAVRAAGRSDVAVVVVGSAEGTESEGSDKASMVLPGRQDELVTRISAANPNTIVVVNAGMPVLMPWAEQVAAVIQVWFPGQAFGEALADTLLGVVEPSGRLPVTLPRNEADSPVLHAHPEAGDLIYQEGLLSATGATTGVGSSRISRSATASATQIGRMKRSSLMPGRSPRPRTSSVR
jgi:beta-glucosidase